MSAKGSGTEKSDEQEEYLRETFNLFDRDGNGWISREEIGKAARAAGCNPSDKLIDDLLSTYDSDKSNKIEYEEFKEFMAEFKARDNTEESIREAFNVFDHDRNGYIEAKELKAIVKRFGQQISDEEIQQMIEAVDANKDEKINIDEFTKFLCHPIK